MLAGANVPASYQSPMARPIKISPKMLECRLAILQL
jgi:hypothetical protein